MENPAVYFWGSIYLRRLAGCGGFHWWVWGPHWWVWGPHWWVWGPHIRGHFHLSRLAGVGAPFTGSTTSPESSCFRRRNRAAASRILVVGGGWWVMGGGWWLRVFRKVGWKRTIDWWCLDVPWPAELYTEGLDLYEEFLHVDNLVPDEGLEEHTDQPDQPGGGV